MKKNYSFHSFFILALTMLLMVLYSFVHERTPLAMAHLNNIYDLKSLFKHTVQTAETDTQSKPQQLTYSPEQLDTTYVSGAAYLEKFFRALHLSKKGKKPTRIAYFGDSLIEGDLITQTLRDLLQQYYGGSGVGYVPLTSAVSGFRTSVRHQFSGSWQKFNLINGSKKFAPGFSGEVFIVNGTAQASYQSSALLVSTATLPSATLYYGREITVTTDSVQTDSTAADSAKTENTNYLVLKGSDKKIYLDGTKTVNAITLNANASTQISFTVHSNGNMPFYGIEFNNNLSGITLDNYSLRGNSGLPLTSISGKQIQAHNEYAAYKLIVLHYGTNVVNKNMRDYNWYRDGLDKVIKHIKTNLPDADILMISPLDRAIKVNGQLQTDPSIPLIVKAEQEAAATNKVCFINLYEWMQGENSMIQWADAQPSLANKDYTHPNGRGAEKVGRFIFELLNGRFEKFEKHMVPLPVAVDTLNQTP